MRPRYTPGLAVAALLLTGCGSSIPDGAVDAEPMAVPEGHPDYDPVMPVGEGGSLEVEADSFEFEITDGRPVTGEIEVTGTNISSDFHDIHFAGAAEGSEIIEMEGGESGSGTVLLFPGETTFWCDVPGHREAGMEETVQVFATEQDFEQAAAEGEIPWLEEGDAGGETDEDGGETDEDGESGDEELEPVDPAA